MTERGLASYTFIDKNFQEDAPTGTAPQTGGFSGISVAPSNAAFVRVTLNIASFGFANFGDVSVTIVSP